MKIFNQIEVAKGRKSDATSIVARLRELVYLQAYERWKSPDLAGYISDDFGLIGDALIIGYSHRWLNGLLDAYLDARFPSGQITERAGELVEDL